MPRVLMRQLKQNINNIINPHAYVFKLNLRDLQIDRNRVVHKVIAVR